MRIKHVVDKNLLLVSLMAFCMLTCAAKSFAIPTGVWKKQTTRVIDLREPDEQVNKGHKNKRPDSTLADMLISAAKENKIMTYTNEDPLLSNTMGNWQLTELLDEQFDTLRTKDPLTGKKTIKLIKQVDYRYSVQTKYRLLENWTFDPATGKTKIEIAGIAPLRKVYDKYYQFRGVQAIFWVKYKDARPIIERYEHYHNTPIVSKSIWNDYFLQNNALLKTGGQNYSELRERTIDMLEKTDTVLRHFNDTRADKTLVQLIMDGVKDKKINAYLNSGNSFNTVISYEELKAEFAWKPDTIIMIDPVDGKEVQKIINHDLDIRFIHKYNILEAWTFDPIAGTTEIGIRGIAPIRQEYDQRGSMQDAGTFFWLRYTDAQPIIDTYETYHPDNTITGKVWADYFDAPLQKQEE